MYEAPQLYEQVRDIFLSNAVTLEPIPVTEDLNAAARYRLPEAGGGGSHGLARDLPAGPIEALVFDIYGTLVMSASGDISLGEDTSSREYRLQHLLDEYDIDAAPGEISSAMKQAVLEDHENSRRRGIEYPEVDIRAMWSSLQELSHLGEEDVSLFAAEYESLVNPVAPMPGLEALIACAAASGLPMGIVSNAQFYTPSMFDAFLGKSLLQLGFHPDLMIFSYRTGHGKPSLFLYEELAQKLDTLQHPGHAVRRIPPELCLYVGNDMLKDVWAASRVGFQTGLFAGDQRSCRTRRDDPRCKNLQADYLFNTLEDICRLISTDR